MVRREIAEAVRGGGAVGAVRSEIVEAVRGREEAALGPEVPC